jgi:hypothetical protein
MKKHLTISMLFAIVSFFTSINALADQNCENKKTINDCFEKSYTNKSKCEDYWVKGKTNTTGLFLLQRCTWSAGICIASGPTCFLQMHPK